MADYTVSIAIVAANQATSVIQDLNRELQSVNNNATRASDNVSQQTSGWDRYKGAIDGARTAIGTFNTAMDMLGTGLELVDLGENVRSVRLAFEALADDPATAAANLQLYRDATRNVISDMELMTASNRMGSMGLAETSEDMAELLRMAQALGSVMSPGATAAQNIDNFTLLLANQSVRRLDSFGISADAVRQRIEELKEEGYSAQEAFTMATLEQGRIALENLGAAADAGATSVDRLSTRWQNFSNNFAEGVANVVDEAAGTVEMLGQMWDAYWVYADAGGLVGQWRNEAMRADVSSDGGFGTNRDQGGATSRQRIEDERAASEQNHELAASYDELVAAKEAYIQQMTEQAAISDFGERTMFGAGMTESVLQVQRMTQDIGGWEENMIGVSNAMMDTANATARAAGEAQTYSTALENMTLSVINSAQLQSQISAGWDPSTATSAALSQATGAYDLSSYGGADLGGTQLFMPEEVQAIQEASTYYSSLVSDAEQLHAQGLINDSELASVRSTADEAARLADNAQRGADAFTNMSLSQAFQQTSGGMAGEMTGDVLANMQASGQFTPEQMQMYQTQLELSTGQQTQSSLNYETIIVPMIADIISRYGADAGAAAIANVQGGMQTATYMGMSDQQIAANMAGMTGYSYVANTNADVGITGGDGSGGAGGQAGPYIGTLGSRLEEAEGFGIDSYMESIATIDTDMASISESSTTFEGSMAASADSVASMKTDFTTASTKVDQISSRLASIGGRTLTVNLRFNTAGARGELENIIREIVGEQGDGGGSTPNPHPGGGGP